MIHLKLLGGDDATRATYNAAAARLANVEIVDGGSDGVVALGADRVSAARDTVKAGTPVLVEAPLSNSVADADALVAGLREADVPLMVGSTRRFEPAVRAVRQSLDAGQLGEPGLLRIHRWISDDSVELGASATDELDLAGWLFGGLPCNVYAVLRGRSGGDCHAGIGLGGAELHVHLGFDGGGMALIDIVGSLPGDRGYESLSLIGSDGAAYADDHHNSHLLLRGGKAAVLCSEVLGSADVAAMLNEFACAIAEARAPCVDATAGRAALLVADAVKQSADSGQALRRNPEGDGYELA